MNQKRQAFRVVGIGLAVLLTEATALRADETPRDLTWAYDGEAFEEPANWKWTQESPEVISSGPGEADRVFFGTAAVDKTVRFNADAVVSNFIVEASSIGGTTFDLANHTLSVSNNMSLKSVGTLMGDHGQTAVTPLLTFRDGTIRVVGTATGTKTWGLPNEDAGGFFINRQSHNYTGINLRFERTTLVATNSPHRSMLTLKGTGADRVNRVHLTENSSWLLKTFAMNTDRSAPFEFCVEKSSFTVTGDMVDDGKGACRWLFTSGATLYAGSLRSLSRTAMGLAYVFDGGAHELGSTQASGDNGSCSLSYTDVVVSNGAHLAAAGSLSIRSASTIKVCAGSSLTTSWTARIGHQAYNNAYFGDSALIVDDGKVTLGGLEIGSFERYSNNCVRIVGPLSRVESTGAVGFNYGATVAIEIPEEGYHDAEGNARAPVYTKSRFSSTTTETCRPVSLELATRAFDRTNPRASVELLRAEGDSSAAFAALMATVVFTDAPQWHGEVSVSDDGKSLLYTAPARRGMAVIIR